jgi:hypothetical protein
MKTVPTEFQGALKLFFAALIALLTPCRSQTQSPPPALPPITTVLANPSKYPPEDVAENTELYRAALAYLDSGKFTSREQTRLLEIFLAKWNSNLIRLRAMEQELDQIITGLAQKNAELEKEVAQLLEEQYALQIQLDKLKEAQKNAPP